MIDLNNTEYDSTLHQKKYEEVFEKEKEKFDELSKTKLIISLVGDVNAGKSRTIEALTGKKLKNVSARPGSTEKISLYELKKDVFIADTPGLNDIREEIVKKAENYVQTDSDLILFILSVDPGLTGTIYKNYLKFKALEKRMFIVLNKVDVYEDEPEEILAVAEHIKEQTNTDPIQISAKKGINIEELNDKIVRYLESNGKDLLFLKISKFREKKVKIWINGASITAFGIGVIPIPGADIIPLTTVQVALAVKIAFIYDIRVRKEDVMALIGATVTGGLGKSIYRWLVQILKGVGWITTPMGEAVIATIAGTIASATTYGYGWACNEYYKSDMTMELEDVKSIFEASFKSYLGDKVEKIDSKSKSILEVFMKKLGM